MANKKFIVQFAYDVNMCLNAGVLWGSICFCPPHIQMFLRAWQEQMILLKRGHWLRIKKWNKTFHGTQYLRPAACIWPVNMTHRREIMAASFFRALVKNGRMQSLTKRKHLNKGNQKGLLRRIKASTNDMISMTFLTKKLKYQTMHKVGGFDQRVQFCRCGIFWRSTLYDLIIISSKYEVIAFLYMSMWQLLLSNPKGREGPSNFQFDKLRDDLSIFL